MATRRQIWPVRVLAKTAVFRNMRDSPDSPTFAKPCCADSPDSQTFANHLPSTCQTCRHSPSRVAWTRQTRKRRVWRVLREFSESGEFGECRLDYLMHIKYVICAKNNLSYNARVVAKTADFGNVSDSPDSPTFAKPCRADSPDSRKASLARFIQI